VAVAAAAEIVGREPELDALRRFVEQIAAGPSAAAIRGEAGVGKTVLWRATVQAAEQKAVTVLQTRCVEAEMPLALGGLCDLLDVAYPAVSDELVEPQRRLLAVALGLEAPGDDPPERTALARAFLACVRALALKAPVLLAIDDVQWLDGPSKRSVAFAARRWATHR
jgi:predicted ATPase